MKQATKITLATFSCITVLTGIWLFKTQSLQGAASGARTSPIEKTTETPALMYNCAMHPNYISEKPGTCPFCGMDLTPMEKQEASASTGVKIDPTMVQNMGVRTEILSLRNLQSEVRSSGKVQVDESRVFIVNARVMGYVEKLHVNTTGEKVHKGQALLDLYSPDLVSAQEEFLTALSYAKSMNGTTGTGASELMESTRRRLLNWGVTTAEIAQLEKDKVSRKNLSLFSPASGVVLEKMVEAGQNIMAGMQLYRIADLSKVWVVATLFQRDLPNVKIGSLAEVDVSYGNGKIFSGKVTFISPILDPNTKTAEARIEITNTPTLDLKPEMFASVRILSSIPTKVLAAPNQAIIRTGRRNIAIIDLGNGTFEPRDVELGMIAGDYVEIKSGVQAGENLVISSQFLIDSESNLKAAIQQMRSGK